MKKQIIVTPLYYILNDGKSKELLMNMDEDTTLIIFDGVSPLPPVMERYYALMGTLNLPEGVFDVEEIVYPDADKHFVEEVSKHIKELESEGNEVTVHYFPTENKLAKRARWADVIYNDFLIDNLGKSWNNLKEKMDEHFVGRYASTWEHYMFGMKGVIDTVHANVVFYGEFESENGSYVPIMLGVRDYETGSTFSPFKSNLEPLDFISDLGESSKSIIGDLGLTVKDLLDFKGTPNSSYGYDVVLELEGSKENLEILTNIMNRVVDKRISPTKDLAVHLPSSTNSLDSVWFERIISDKLGEE